MVLTTSLLDFTQKSENIANYTEFFHYFKSFVIRLPFYIFEHFETENSNVSNERIYVFKYFTLSSPISEPQKFENISGGEHSKKPLFRVREIGNFVIRK